MEKYFYLSVFVNLILKTYEDQWVCENSKMFNGRCIFNCLELSEFHVEYFENVTNCQISLNFKSKIKSNLNSKIFLDQNYFKGDYKDYVVDKIFWKLSCVEKIEKNFLQNLLKYDNTKFWSLSITNSRCLGSINDSIFEFIPYLRNLDLSYNNIIHLSNDCFKGLSMLEKLKLNNNQLRYISNEIFKSLKSLEILELSKNAILNLEPLAFQSMSRLELLKLNRNKIKNLSNGIFGSFEVLHTLDLSSNKLESFEVSHLSSLCRESLRNLYLNNNQLQSLSKNIIDFDNIDPSHFDITLNNNSWVCDNKLVWMKTKPGVYFIRASSIKCANPYKFRNRTLDRISVLHLNLTYEDKIFPDLTKNLSLKDEMIGVTVSIFCVILILTILFVGYRYNWCAMISGYNMNNKKFKTTENETDEEAKLCMVMLEGNKIAI